MDVQLGHTPTLRVVPERPMTSPAARVISPAGKVLATASAEPSAVDATVESASAADRLGFEDVVEGLRPGLMILVTDSVFGEARARVSTVDADGVRLVQPLPQAPQVGARVQGLDVLVTLPEAATAALEMHRKLEVYTDDDAVSLVFNVVRFPFVGPVTTLHVRDTLARRQGSVRLDEIRLEELRDDANALIRGELLSSRVYLTEFWDPDALTRMRMVAVNYVLATQLDVWPAGVVQDTYVASLEQRLEVLAGKLKTSAEERDANLNGKLDEAEIGAPQSHSTQLVR